MGHREEYKTIHQNNLRFLKNAKNLPYIANKKAIPYQITNIKNVDISEQALRKIQNLFQKKFPNHETDISVLAGLTFSCPSVLFQVSMKNGTKIYESMTISVSENEEGSETASWPLLLVLNQTTKKDITIKIHNFIQRTFKCLLKPIHLTESQISWFTGICINETLKRNINHGMSLTCKLPASAEIDIFFCDDVLSTLWDSVHDCMSDVIHFEELELFFAQMASHINNVYGIDLSQLRISSFLLQGIRLQFSEQFQINAAKPEIIYLLLSFIVSDCLSDD